MAERTIKQDVIAALEKERARLDAIPVLNSTQRLQMQEIEQMLDHLANGPCIIRIEPERPTWPIRL